MPPAKGIATLFGMHTQTGHPIVLQLIEAQIRCKLSPVMTGGDGLARAHIPGMAAEGDEMAASLVQCAIGSETQTQARNSCR